MLRRSLIIAVFALTALSGVAAFAHEGHDGKGWDPKAYTEKLTKELNLTPDQAVKIQAITAQHQEKSKAAMDEKHAAINAVLTPEQKTKYDAIKEEHKKEKEEKWQGKEGKHKHHDNQ